MPSNDLIPVQSGGSIGTTSTKILDAVTADKHRKQWAITNVSTGGQNISLGIGVDAVDGYGLVLGPLQTYLESEGNNYFPTNHKISIVADAANGAYAIFEIQAQGRPDEALR